jgi:DNA mismatch endonuclease (patch repair protein)
MTDVFSRAKRSKIMSRVRGRENAATELRLIQIFRQARISGWRRRRALFGKPDFTFSAARLVIFVDGCFWHGCPLHGSVPTANGEFWARKLSRNVERDRLVGMTLRARSWRVLRIWQHELRNPAKVARRVRRMLVRSNSQRH